MARKLQDRLALASYKTKHGLDNLSFDMVEAHLESNLKRKWPGSSIDTSSISSSSSSSNLVFSSAMVSSPNTAPMFSDSILHSGEYRENWKRTNNTAEATLHGSDSARRKRSRAKSMAPPKVETCRKHWKSAHNLPESSPGSRQYARFPSAHVPDLSFASETSTIPESPPVGHGSDEEGHGVPESPFRMISTQFQSSPPRTPPPTRTYASRQRKGRAGGEEDADLLLHLANSPTPANPGVKTRSQLPSTPPSEHQTLPSSILSTPNATGFTGGFNTPGQTFSWADFVNITPSPAQGAFGNRTPGITKTPLAAKEARRRLNLDSLLPPSGSPNLSGNVRGSSARGNGLGMELGGELVS